MVNKKNSRIFSKWDSNYELAKAGGVPKPRRWALQLSIVMSEWLPFEVPKRTLQRRERNSLQCTSALERWQGRDSKPDSEKHSKRCSVSLEHLETEYLETDYLVSKGSRDDKTHLHSTWSEFGENIFTYLHQGLSCCVASWSPKNAVWRCTISWFLWNHFRLVCL